MVCFKRKCIDELLVPILKSTLDIKQDQKCVLVGTLYKDMKLKPSILKEYAREVFAEVTEDLDNFVSDDDLLILEDEYGRVKLISENGKLKVNELISGEIIRGKIYRVLGVYIACLGKEINSEFMVTDYCFLDMAPQDPLPKLKTDAYVALVCGVQLGDTNFDFLATQMMFDYLSGKLGVKDEQQFVSKIARVVFAGNNVAAPEKKKDQFDIRGVCNEIDNSVNLVESESCRAIISCTAYEGF